MNRLAMVPLGRRLRRLGFVVHYFAYNSVSGSLTQSAERLKACINRVAQLGPVALVGHSLGGLVSLQASLDVPQNQIAALVMVASPYGGAHAGAKLSQFPGGARIGPAVHEWSRRVPRPRASVPVFTISGTRSSGLGRFFCRFDSPNDGTVTVAEAHYPGATSRILPVSHSGMLFDKEVALQIANWLHPLDTTLT